MELYVREDWRWSAKPNWDRIPTPGRGAPNTYRDHARNGPTLTVASLEEAREMAEGLRDGLRERLQAEGPGRSDEMTLINVTVHLTSDDTPGAGDSGVGMRVQIVARWWNPEVNHNGSPKTK